MRLLRQPVLASCLLAGLSVAPAGAAWAAQDSGAATSRALGHIARFPAEAMHGANQTYDVRDVTVDRDGTEHVRFDRRYNGLRVIGGDLVVHGNAGGGFRGVSRTLQHPVNVNARAAVNAMKAVSAALSGRSGYASVGTPESVVYARSSSPELAYDVALNGTKADGTPSELHVIVSGLTGRVLDSWDDVETARSGGSGSTTTSSVKVAVAGGGTGYFNGPLALTTDQWTTTTTSNGVTTVSKTWYLRDPSRGNQYTINMANRTSGGSVFASTTNGNNWGSGSLANAETVGVDAQYGTAVTWDYYLQVHGRSGIANDGKGAYNRVHYGSRYNNAFWTNSCFCMTYGDGDGTTFNPFDSLDVAGHEMSHGVTSRTANLAYSGESGGLNEATSDIFGTAVEFHANNAFDPGDFYIGEELYRSGNSALRSMIQPSTDGYSADCWYAGVGSLDVHYSSGVANHFYYLASQGSGSSVTCKAGDTRIATGGPAVTGVGRQVVEKIWYRALTVYMTSSTNYAGARAATLSAATDLYGASSAEYAAVAAAWSAVNVN
ncbi:MAG: hypothetical protein RLZZ200_688 [Pseudomonadota bacterium]|jgi:Zn-dependent metalloprotease